MVAIQIGCLQSVEDARMAALNIDDDDADLVVRELERAFDIVISHSEAASCRTLGDVFDLVARKEADVGGAHCASAITFYRLRRVFAASSPRPRLGPSTQLQDLTSMSVKRLFNEIEAQTGLQPPRAESSWIGTLRLFLGLAGLLTTLPVAIFFGSWAWATGALVTAAVLMMAADPRRLPPGCETLGDLSKKTARLNLGRLAKAGARIGRKDLWESLIEVISQFPLTPVAAMTSDALLLRWQAKER
jgi:hypothetical protein